MSMAFIKKNYLIFIIIVAAFLVRVVAANPGYPPVHTDEVSSYSTAIHMLSHNLEPDRFDYPALVPFLNLLVYCVFILPVVLFGLFILHPGLILDAIGLGSQFFVQFQEQIFGPRLIYAMFWTRYISAFMGAGAVLMVYFTAARLFNKKTGLIAAFFVVFNYRHVLGSTFGLPDVYNSFFSMLSLYASALLLEKNSKRRYLFAGLTVGLAIATKYQIFSLLPFLYAHLVWAFKLKSIKYLLNKYFIMSLVVIPAVFLLVNPYLIFNLGEFKRMSNIIYLRYQMGILKIRPYPYFYLFHWGIGALPFIAILAGMISMLFSKPKIFFLISFFVFPYFYIITFFSSGGLFPRNFATVIPILMIFAGFFLSQIHAFIKKISFLPNPGMIIVIIVVIINLNPISNSLTLAYYYHKPWNLTILPSWLIDNLPSNSSVREYNLFNSSELNSALSRKNIQEIPWTYSFGPHSVAEFQDEGTDFAILNATFFDSITWWWRQGASEIFLTKNTIPFDYIQSSFFGLSLKELMQYTVKEIYKPWQAADETNYLVFKIPLQPKDLGVQKAYFDFNDKDAMWKIKGTFGQGKPTVTWVNTEGKSMPGSIEFQSGTGEETARVSSEFIQITQGKLYTVGGWIKNSPVLKEGQIESFIRIDFYKEKNDSSLGELGEAVAISKRAPVSGEWEKVQTSLVAPISTKYMTVSFQRFNMHSDITSFLDDVIVYESNGLLGEKFINPPYIKTKIPLESIYPNSFL
ncbi:MAG: glycosyltransferase family 39 protein [Candidatus Levybacteria bacterium]|nr:glycosyltransferase family 39 protein [Candidatus Levybacteria bacterium]